MANDDEWEDIIPKKKPMPQDVAAKMVDVWEPDGSQAGGDEWEDIIPTASPTRITVNPIPEQQGIPRTILDQSLNGALGGFGDEITDRIGAGIASLETGEKYDDLLGEARGMSQERLKQQVEQNPVTAITSNLAGGLATGIGAAGTKAGQAVGNMLGRGNLAARATKMGASGALSTAIYGAGTAEDGKRLEGAGESIGTGALIGGAIPIVGSIGGKVITKLADTLAFKGAVKGGEIVASDLPKPLQKVYARLRADYPDDADFNRVLNSYGSSSGKTLLESAGERTKNLGEGAAMFPSGGAKANEFFQEAIDAAPDKIKDTLSKTVSPKNEYYKTLDDIVSQGREKASPVYKGAFRANQSIKSPIIDKILSQTQEGADALKEAASEMQLSMAKVSKPDKELTDLARDLGMAGQVGKGLKLETIDLIKKALDKKINQAYRAGEEGYAGRLVSAKNAIVSEADRLDRTNMYAKARAISGDYLSNRKAMDLGTSFLKHDSQIVKGLVENMGATEKEAYRVGVLKSIRDNIENTGDGANFTKIFSKQANRDKLSAVLSPKQYQKLMDDVKTTDNIFKLRNQITGNSRTEIRRQAAQEFTDDAQEALQDMATSGVRATIAKRGIGWMKKTFSGLSDKTAGEVADILFEQDPKKKFAIVQSLVREANQTKDAVRRTNAAQKLGAYYGISEKLTKIKGGTLAAGNIAGTERGGPMKLTIRPEPKYGVK